MLVFEEVQLSFRRTRTYRSIALSADGVVGAIWVAPVRVHRLPLHGSSFSIQALYSVIRLAQDCEVVYAESHTSPNEAV